VSTRGEAALVSLSGDKVCIHRCQWSALSRNTPKLGDGVEILLANCLAHGRRQFVEVAANFPEPCRYVLETLGDIYKSESCLGSQW
jgi:hypothetical protein